MTMPQLNEDAPLCRALITLLHITHIIAVWFLFDKVSTWIEAVRHIVILYGDDLGKGWGLAAGLQKYPSSCYDFVPSSLGWNQPHRIGVVALILSTGCKGKVSSLFLLLYFLAVDIGFQNRNEFGRNASMPNVFKSKSSGGPKPVSMFKLLNSKWGVVKNIII